MSRPTWTNCLRRSISCFCRLHTCTAASALSRRAFFQNVSAMSSTSTISKVSTGRRAWTKPFSKRLEVPLVFAQRDGGVREKVGVGVKAVLAGVLAGAPLAPRRARAGGFPGF